MLNNLSDEDFKKCQQTFRDKKDDYNVFVFLLEQEEKRKLKNSFIPSFFNKLVSKIKDIICF